MKYELDEEEKEILSTFEKGEWEKVPGMEAEIKRHVEYAKATHRKDKRINIRISEKDMEMIQRKAIEDGIPYQTLISSVIHRYISGRLVDTEKIILSTKEEGVSMV